MSPPITILIEPPRIEVPIMGLRGQHAADPLATYRAFAEALRRDTPAAIEVRTGFLRDVAEGFVIVRSSDYDAMMEEVAEAVRATTAQRTILLDVDHSSVLRWLERYRFAGAIEKHRWFEWEMRPDDETGGGLHGLRTVAAAMGATVFESEHFATERYAVISSDKYRDLPELVVGYVDALWALRA